MFSYNHKSNYIVNEISMYDGDDFWGLHNVVKLLDHRWTVKDGAIGSIVGQYFPCESMGQKPRKN